MSENIPYNIATESGKELWNKMNQNYGSSVWGIVGEGIEKIELEIENKIISLIESKLWVGLTLAEDIENLKILIKAK